MHTQKLYFLFHVFKMLTYHNDLIIEIKIRHSYLGFTPLRNVYMYNYACECLVAKSC